MSDDNKGIDKELIQGHDYDGIQELDNPLPRWWLVTFYATIIFAVVYYAYYEIAGGPTLSQELEKDLSQIQVTQQKADANQPQVEGVDMKALVADVAAMEKAKGHYIGKCAACHGPNGEGIIGPNLTDKFWIHGKGDFSALVKVIRDGIAAKGMPPWKGQIPDEEILELTAYLSTFVGTNPANGKAPEGEAVE